MSLNYLLLGGCPRSGTTMMAYLLNCHPAIGMTIDLDWRRFDERLTALFYGEDQLRRLYERKKDPKEQWTLDDAMALTFQSRHKDEVLELLYRRTFAAKWDGLRYLGDKYNVYYQQPDFFENWRENLTVIHITRNPLDTINSIRRRSHHRKLGQDPNWSARYENIDVACQEWNHAFRYALAQEGREHFIHLQYEDLVFATEPTVRRLMERLGLTPEFDFERWKPNADPELHFKREHVTPDDEAFGKLELAPYQEYLRRSATGASSLQSLEGLPQERFGRDVAELLPDAPSPVAPGATAPAAGSGAASAPPGPKRRKSSLRRLKSKVRHVGTAGLKAVVRWSEGETRRLAVWPAFETTEEAAFYAERLAWYVDPATPAKFLATCRQTPPATPPHWEWRQAQEVPATDLLGTLVHLTHDWQAYHRLTGHLRTHAQALAIGINETKREEYKDLCHIQWALLSTREREAFIEHNQRKWERFKAARQAEGLTKSYIIGNGPTAGLAMREDLSDGYRFAANSCVNNADFMAAVRPHGLVCGDTVWHLGSSPYAKRYRADVRAYLAAHDTTLFVPLPFGYPITREMAEVDEKVIYIPARRQEPQFDLSRHFVLNLGMSVLNTMLLPVAGSLTKELILYGVDGQAPKVSENDIWDHAVDMQYSEELVAAGHTAHPTFDLFRQKRDEVTRFYETTELSVHALQALGYKLQTAAPSYNPSLRGLARTENP